MATKESVEGLINEIEATLVAPKIRDFSIQFYLHVLYFVALAGIGIIINLNPTTTTALSSFGLEGLGISANFKNIDKVINVYLKDKRNLEDYIGNLRSRLSGCDNNAEFDDLRKAIVESLKAV